VIFYDSFGMDLNWYSSILNCNLIFDLCDKICDFGDSRVELLVVISSDMVELLVVIDGPSIVIGSVSVTMLIDACQLTGKSSLNFQH